MPINGEQMGQDFLDGMEALYGVSSTTPVKCTEMSKLCDYVLDNIIGTGTPAFSVLPLTGAAAAAYLGTDNAYFITFLDGFYGDYVTANFNGTISGLNAPLDAELAFQAGADAYEAEFGEPIPGEDQTRLLTSVIITQLNNVTVVFDPITSLITSIT